MFYDTEYITWIEQEWNYRLHGRSIISSDNYSFLVDCANKNIPINAIITAMDIFLQRREALNKGRSFVALRYIENDITNIMKQMPKLNPTKSKENHTTWNKVKKPIQSDMLSRLLFDIWKQKAAVTYNLIKYCDAENIILKKLLVRGEIALKTREGNMIKLMQDELHNKMTKSGLSKDTTVWLQIWKHHWMRTVFEFWHIPW